MLGLKFLGFCVAQRIKLRPAETKGARLNRRNRIALVGNAASGQGQSGPCGEEKRRAYDALGPSGEVGISATPLEQAIIPPPPLPAVRLLATDDVWQKSREPATFPSLRRKLVFQKALGALDFLLGAFDKIREAVFTLTRLRSCAEVRRNAIRRFAAAQDIFWKLPLG